MSNQPTLSRPLQLRQPARLGIGPGCAAACPGELASRGVRRLLLVCSGSARAHADGLLAECGRLGLETCVLTGVPAEPSVADFENLLAKADAFAAEAVLGLGGGSVLDVAKLVAALHGTGLSVRSYFGNGLLPGRARHLVCLPTTAGAGSEASPNAILYDEVDQLKKAVISPHLVPDATFVDALLTLTVPPAVTAATGLDALTHCIEAYANRNAHPVMDFYALEGARLIGANIVTAVREGGNVSARAALSLGSYYGGLCLGPVNTAAVHALAYPLGSRFRLAHGLSNALLLPHVIRFNAPACPRRYAELGAALGLPRAENDADAAAAFADHLSQLCADCGLPPSLSAVGVKEADLPAIAADAMKIQRLLTNNPRELTLEDALSLYRRAL
jgi:alcohol dehydrogenase class IV